MISKEGWMDSIFLGLYTPSRFSSGISTGAIPSYGKSMINVLLHFLASKHYIVIHFPMFP
jgi:hypothetical protein